MQGALVTGRSDAVLPAEPYADQVQCWPRDGRHIMAHYDDETIVVYQAYNSGVADYAVKHGQLGGPHFSFARMSWIKPNFLWMMYRCGWASKENQERVLGLRIGVAFFESILEAAVPSSFDADLYSGHEDWKRALQRSEVRLQWDPDHDPSGAKQERRAVQLGLRGETLRAFATTQMREVIDMTPFVHEQAHFVNSEHLLTPVERTYRPKSAAARRQVALSDDGGRA
jgi:hypothetical protein